MTQEKGGSHRPDGEQGPEGAKKCCQDSHRERSPDGQQVRPRRYLDGQDAGQDSHDDRLQGHAENDSRHAGGDRHDLSLQEVARQEHSRAGPENFQYGDRRTLTPHERCHGRGHADAADQETDEPDQTKVRRHLGEETPQPRLRLVEGRHPDGRVRDFARDGLPALARRHSIGQAKQGSVAYAAPELEEPCAFECLAADQHARSQPEAHRAVRLLTHNASDGHRPVADQDTVTDSHVEPRQQGLVHERTTVGEQLCQWTFGLGLHAAVQGIVWLHRFQLDQQGTPSTRIADHPDELPHTGHGSSGRGNPLHGLCCLVPKGTHGPKLEVPTHERPGLTGQSAVNVGGERADRGQRRHPDGDAGEKANEVAPPAPHLAQGY